MVEETEKLDNDSRVGIRSMQVEREESRQFMPYCAPHQLTRLGP